VDLELAADDAEAPERVALAVRQVTGLGATVQIVSGDSLTAGIEDRFRKRRRLYDRRKEDGRCA
jgi:hypothetical protein